MRFMQTPQDSAIDSVAALPGDSSGFRFKGEKMKVVPTDLACPGPIVPALSFDADSCQRRTRLDAGIDLLARLMPDLPMLGAAMLLLTAYLAATGSDFGADPATEA